MLGERIAKGLVFDGRLWLSGRMVSRDDPTGALVSINLNDSSRLVHFDRSVLDITESAGRLWVLRSESLKNREYVVSVWKAGAFEDVVRFKSPSKDDPIALLGHAGAPMILCRGAIRVLSADDHKLTVIPLKANLRSGLQVSSAVTSDGAAAYVGFNNGEWGGGLQKVDLHTGLVDNVERRDSKQLCAGPLNSDCDPVTGVVADATNKSCVLVSVGLVHMGFSDGRVLRVCGNEVEVVSETPIEVAGPAKSLKETEAIYGLTSAADGGIWAISFKGLYRFDRDGNKVAQYSLPKLNRVAGIYMSREIPGVIVIRTDLNWAVSVSGYTPLVIPTDGSDH